MLNAAAPSAMPLSAPPRQRLLEANGGGWEGLFHRLGPDGREIERRYSPYGLLEPLSPD